MASTLAGTPPAHVGEACRAGTLKLLLVKVVDKLVNGPVTVPVSVMDSGPMVHDTPKRGAVDPLTVAVRVTFNPLEEESQSKVPVIVPGLAVNPISGDFPLNNTRTTE